MAGNDDETGDPDEAMERFEDFAREVFRYRPKDGTETIDEVTEETVIEETVTEDED
jgi:hypothetical protein